jgi:hypothetical protein
MTQFKDVALYYYVKVYLKNFHKKFFFFFFFEIIQKSFK